MYGDIIQNVKHTMPMFKTLKGKKQNKTKAQVSKWVLAKHNIIYLQRQNDTIQVQIFKNQWRC